MERLRAEIGYRMWCLDQGYMSDKDREGCDNWLLLPDSELHETDRRAKPEILELADSVIDALAAAGYRIVPIVDDATHLIQFTEAGWTIAHPISERIDLDSLFACPVRWDGDDPGVSGVFELLDAETIGEEVPRG